MTWQELTPEWSPEDLDVGRAWSRSGAQWLTHPDVPVPARLVRHIAGIISYLDAHGAALSSLFPETALGLLAERAATLGLPTAGTTSCGGSARLFETRTGWIAVSLPRFDDVASLPAWLGVANTRVEAAPWSLVENRCRQEEQLDLVNRAVLLGLAVTGLGETTDDRPVLVEHLGEATSLPLAGLVVANVASLWAGPLAASVLQRLGARVITVESVERPDGARAHPAFFDLIHAGTESVALELTTREGRTRLASLLSRVDVVIEGSRPRALAQLGIDARHVGRTGPQVWMSITGHGRDEPGGRRIGFGDDAAIAGALCGRVGETPHFLADAIADPLAGLTAAAAIVQLVGVGGRWLGDVALSRVAASMAPNETDSRQVVRRPWRPTVRPGKPSSLPLGRDTESILREFEVVAE